MHKILRWIGYAATAVGAILIIWFVISGLCHNRCTPPPPHMEKMEKGGMHEPCCNKDIAKADSAACKHEEHGKAMADTSKHKCCAHPVIMKEKICVVEPPRQLNLLQLAISLFLLAIALFIINKQCCCGCHNGKCDCKDDKKES